MSYDPEQRDDVLDALQYTSRATRALLEAPPVVVVPRGDLAPGPTLHPAALAYLRAHYPQQGWSAPSSTPLADIADWFQLYREANGVAPDVLRTSVGDFPLPASVVSARELAGSAPPSPDSHSFAASQADAEAAIEEWDSFVAEIRRKP